MIRIRQVNNGHLISMALGEGEGSAGVRHNVEVTPRMFSVTPGVL